MEYSLVINKINKKYKDFCLTDVSFCLPKGMIMGFIGQNGAGKTTTIKSILNLIPLESGNITIFGKDHIAEEKLIKEDLGVVFDDLYFDDAFSIFDINKIMKHIYSNWDSTKFFELASKFELPQNKPVGKLSRGMRMKTAIAVAMSHNAKLLILDEPTSGLDPIARNEVLDLIQQFVCDENHSCMFSSHITQDLDRIADYLTFISKGKICLTGEKIDIMERHILVKASKEDIEALPSDAVIASRNNRHNSEALIDQSLLNTKLDDKYIIDKPTIDTIMIFYNLRGSL